MLLIAPKTNVFGLPSGEQKELVFDKAVMVCGRLLAGKKKSGGLYRSKSCDECRPTKEAIE